MSLHVWRGIDIERAILPHDACYVACVAIRDAEATALIIYESIKGDSARGAEILLHHTTGLQNAGSCQAGSCMHFVRNPSDGAMKNAVLPIAPFQCLPIQVGHVPKDAPYKKVLFHETDEPLYLPFSKRMSGLAQLGRKIQVAHEDFVVFCHTGFPSMSLRITTLFMLSVRICVGMPMYWNA